MVLVILMQRPKSEGLGAAFGGAVTENIFGAQTTNVLVKFTAWLAGIFFLLTFGLSILYAHRSAGGNTGLRRELMRQQAGAEASPVPAGAQVSPSPVGAQPSGTASGAQPSVPPAGGQTSPASTPSSSGASPLPAPGASALPADGITPAAQPTASTSGVPAAGAAPTAKPSATP
jgi:preprotein translocase subunit SecG